MFSKRDCVRIKMAPQTRMGTIEGSINKSNGRVEYHFVQDPRLQEAVPAGGPGF